MAATRFLAELIGLLQLSLGVSLLFQKAVFIKVLTDLTANRSALFMVGVLLLLAGLAIVLTHNIWTGGVLTIAITLIGWILILRGLASMFLPGDGMPRMIRWCKVEELSWLYAAWVLAIGAWLTWAGFAT
jgi:hypothetical protein